MNILGISCYYHDAAAAVIVDGVIVAAAQEERFTRIKHDERFPVHAVRYCLDEAGLDINDIDFVAFYDKPLLKFERLLETYYAFSPKGWMSFMRSMPVWIKEKVFLKDNVRKGLKEVDEQCNGKQKLLFPEHHLSHAASAFYPSPYNDAAILTIDGVGEWCTTSICKGSGKDITVLKELHFPHSVGLLYSAFTYFLGFKVNSGEYKLMGLAPYGNDGEAVERYKKIILDHICTVYEDGSIFLHQDYFTYATALRMVDDAKWQKLFGFPRKTEDEPLQQHHCDLGLAIQQVTEDIVMKLAATAKNLTGSDNLCMAGGVALNCVANGKLGEAGIFKNIYIQPAAGDAGGAVGAALAAYHIQQEQPRTTIGTDAMRAAYLGIEYTDKEIVKVLNRYDAPADHIEDEILLADTIAAEIASGKVVGWFQGRMEFGPRALGHRSILADPRNPEMQKKLNIKIKFREGFRPFAPLMLQEEAERLFGLQQPSPYMLFVHPIKEQYRKALPANYQSLSLMEKLYVQRSELPAITHIDFSARIQTVAEDANPQVYHLLHAFKKLTGYGVLINTSFNVRGEPIVCSPDDAYRCFMQTDMDMLVMGNFVLYKEAQPNAGDKEKWQRRFAGD
ncbi:MAG: carbamoyltransferase [Bacteroidetes bacterium]|nr:carbamoyltransferase [Bacteroidota bacterium]